MDDYLQDHQVPACSTTAPAAGVQVPCTPQVLTAAPTSSRTLKTYTREYLESVAPAHRAPAKPHEWIAWWCHVLARTLAALVTGALVVRLGGTLPAWQRHAPRHPAPMPLVAAPLAACRHAGHRRQRVGARPRQAHAVLPVCGHRVGRRRCAFSAGARQRLRGPAACAGPRPGPAPSCPPAPPQLRPSTMCAPCC